MHDNSQFVRAFRAIVKEPKTAIAFLGLVLVLFTSGCNEPAPGKLTGVVLMKGKPVFPGVVMLRSGSGKGLSASLSNEGKFTAFGAEAGEQYSVAIEPIKLAGVSRAARAKGSSGSDSSGTEAPRRREDTVPEKFQQANIDIPKKYASFESSGLTIDCRDGLPAEPVVLDLK